ncbi:hypothetical protein AMAG_16276 [Allomyces macrogynus ATCC 38327]|uniref:Cyclin-domain-containing protein n=1 Tax=Allomyces macrogynus (strain ATCC 38327) TaxID=578462 RepID=A0A0L0TAR7_ALLM3|nr:hypothetical protein AMAG_16276 [Allomyces macrogynus ATCC 38327]|eukprot:KNE71847.1 hypothetical protein AMAG_16276 [Allomyces macrogynus ATCC 38327]
MSRPPTPAKPLPPQPLPQLAPFMGHGTGPFPVILRKTKPSSRAPPFAAVHPLRSALSRTWSTVSAAARKRRVSAATSGERSGSGLSDASTTDANTNRTSDAAAANQTASPEAVPAASTTRSLGNMGATATASQQQGQALHGQASMNGHHVGQGGLTGHGSLGHASSLHHHASQGQQHQGPQQQQQQQQQPVTMDLLTYPTRDLVRIMAALLHDIASANDAVPVASNLGVSRFHARAIPPITIHSYLARILKYAPAPNAVFVAVLVYLDRMARARLPFIVCSANVHRLLITAVMVATKFFSDVFYTNPHYAKVGGLPTNELNQLELEFLFMNEFNLAISPDEFQHYADRLLAHSLGALPPPALPAASVLCKWLAQGEPLRPPGPGDATCSNDAAPSTTAAAAAAATAASTAPPPEVHVRPPSPASTPSASGANANANHNVPVAVLDALNLHSAPTSPARPAAGTSASSAAPTPAAPNMLATSMASPISPAPPAHHDVGTPAAPTPARALTMPPVYPPWTAPGAPPPPPTGHPWSRQCRSRGTPRPSQNRGRCGTGTACRARRPPRNPCRHSRCRSSRRSWGTAPDR